VYKNKTIIGIITARSKSKGLPKKNIKLLAGIPLIARTIQQAKKSRYLDKLIVSTDGIEIAEISCLYKADVPFLRPKRLAKDKSSSVDTLLHALDWYKKDNIYFDIIVLLQPTSPLRTAEDIDNSIELLFSKKAKAIVSVCEAEHHPYWANILPKNGSMKNFLSVEIKNKNRQSLPIFYRLNGAVYTAFSDYFIRQNGFFGDKTFSYIMPKERSVDIDTELDFKFAELLCRKT